MELDDADPCSHAPAPTPPVAWPYVRGADGVWHYEWGDPVPGARDLLLQDIYQPPGKRGQEIKVPLELARRQPEMAWCLAYWDPRAGDTLVVPWTSWEQHRRDPVGMDAPELSATRLLDSDAVAARCALTARTVANYLARGLMPAPVARLGGSPLWPASVIDRWSTTRPGRPGRPAGSGAGIAQPARRNRRRSAAPSAGRRRSTPPALDGQPPATKTSAAPAPTADGWQGPPLSLDEIDQILDRHERSGWGSLGDHLA